MSMKRLFESLSAFVLFVVMMSPLSLGAQAKSADVSLITDAASLEQGKMTVGVLLRIHDGMHIYWKNPGGETGFPTSVKWKLPDGAKVSDLQWMTPKSFKNADDSLGIGYEGEVLLKAEIDTTAAKDKSAISAVVRWLACKDDACFPGRAELQLATSLEKAKAAEAVFKKFEHSFPVAAAPDVASSAMGAGLTIVAPEEYDSAQFFPDSGVALAEKKKTADGKFVFETKSKKGVLALSGKNGKKAFEVK